MESVEKSPEDVLLESQKDMYLTFHVDREDYAIEIRYVSEIIGMQKITEVPEMPNYIKGMINLRGRVIPVMDIRARFLLPEQPYSDRTCIIVTNLKGLSVGLVVDAVNEVTLIEPRRIEPAGTGKSSVSRYIQSLGKLEDGVKIILAMDRILADEGRKPDV
jgi:purine-binding chemotaxis protein CheW